MTEYGCLQRISEYEQNYVDITIETLSLLRKEKQLIIDYGKEGKFIIIAKKIKGLLPRGG